MDLQKGRIKGEEDEELSNCHQRPLTGTTTTTNNHHQYYQQPPTNRQPPTTTTA
jgi:hypothetical protein